MSHQDDLAPAIRSFERFVKLPLALTVKTLCDINLIAEDLRRHRDDGTLENGGVYVCFDQQERVLYVGLSQRLIQRITPNHSSFAVDMWYAVFIEFPDGYVFLAAALEAYLIFWLQPRDNERWKNCRAEKHPEFTTSLLQAD